MGLAYKFRSISKQRELLGLKLIARDEFAVDKWIGRYRINSKDWVHVDLPAKHDEFTKRF